MKNMMLESVSIKGEHGDQYNRVLTPAALSFLAKLHKKFNPRRLELLLHRKQKQRKIDQGENPQFSPETANIRSDLSWQVAPTPKDLEKRWVEITGPTEKKMLINALNSGADIFMADFEDSNSPTWKNMVEGQLNLIDAISGTLSFISPEGKQYKLNEKTATLMVRPRGWHLFEKNFYIDGEPISGSLFDFGLYFFHNAQALLKKETGPYFYLAKLENQHEARLWNDVFIFAQAELGIPRGTIRATVLLETILAAFDMEEILYELREHSAGLNAGRWDYIFSIIKKFHSRHDLLFPDRAQITMTVPFMRSYTELLVKTCHRRGAHAIGGMAAFIPSRKDSGINEIAIKKVREDKLRESSDGFDGTWVAHPDLVPIARSIFAEVLEDKPNQKEKKREEVQVSAKDLMDFAIPDSKITEEGVRKNISISLLYLDSWLSGVGAAAIYNLMEDVATAEISRAQLWQWVHHPHALLDDGRQISAKLYEELAHEEMEKINLKHESEARTILDSLVLSQEFPEFLTLIAYEKI